MKVRVGKGQFEKMPVDLCGSDKDQLDRIELLLQALVVRPHVHKFKQVISFDNPYECEVSYECECGIVRGTAETINILNACV